jgi:hypothetical protein
MLTSGPRPARTGQSGGHQAGSVHQPPQDQAVPDAGEDARSDPERPLIDREDPLPERGVGPAGRVLAEGRDGQHADDADGDEGALHQARRHVGDGARFVHALVDRVRHHGRPDVRDDEQEFEHGPDRDERLGVGPRAGDVVPFVVEHRGVEEESRGYRGHEGDDPQPPGEGRDPSVVHGVSSFRAACEGPLPGLPRNTPRVLVPSGAASPGAIASTGTIARPSQTPS